MPPLRATRKACRLADDVGLLATSRGLRCPGGSPVLRVTHVLTVDLGFVVDLGTGPSGSPPAAITWWRCLLAGRGWGWDWLGDAVAGRQVVQFGLVSETAVRFAAADGIA